MKRKKWIQMKNNNKKGHLVCDIGQKNENCDLNFDDAQDHMRIQISSGSSSSLKPKLL